MRNIDSSSFEKVFGVAEERTLRKNQTAPNIPLESVVEEENSYEENSSPPLRETRAQTSLETRAQAST